MIMFNLTGGRFKGGLGEGYEFETYEECEDFIEGIAAIDKATIIATETPGEGSIIEAIYYSKDDILVTHIR